MATKERKRNSGPKKTRCLISINLYKHYACGILWGRGHEGRPILACQRLCTATVGASSRSFGIEANMSPDAHHYKPFRVGCRVEVLTAERLKAP